jgi:hypothetical protein
MHRLHNSKCVYNEWESDRWGHTLVVDGSRDDTMTGSGADTALKLNDSSNIWTMHQIWYMHNYLHGVELEETLLILRIGLLYLRLSIVEINQNKLAINKNDQKWMSKVTYITWIAKQDTNYNNITQVNNNKTQITRISHKLLKIFLVKLDPFLVFGWITSRPTAMWQYVLILYRVIPYVAPS